MKNEKLSEEVLSAVSGGTSAVMFIHAPIPGIKPSSK